MHFNNFAEGGIWRFSFGGRAWWERGGQFLEGEGSEVLEIANINFISLFLFDLLFMCRLKDVVLLVIFTYVFGSL